MRNKQQPTPACLPGESQGPGSLGGCRLWGRTESDTTDATQQQQQQQQQQRMCLEDIMLIERNQTQKDNYCMISLVSVF